MKELEALLRRLEMPEDCIAQMCAVYDKICGCPSYGGAAEYFFSPAPEKETGRALLDTLAREAGTDVLQSDMAAVLAAFVRLKDVYEEMGLPAEMYDRACLDARCKLWECRRVKGVWGTFVTHWFYRFFTPSRFALGRFQFETDVLKGGEESVTVENIPGIGSITLPMGAPAVRVHIPSTGEPLTDEARMDSYRQAYAFYKKDFGPLVPFTCNSWLLYEKHPDFLPKGSNVLKFMGDFRIFGNVERHTFRDLWRLFCVPNETPYEALPESNSLFRAYKSHLLNGGLTGTGTGLFLFDGEHIY